MIFEGLNAIMRKGDSDSMEITGLSLADGDTLYFTVKDHAYTDVKRLSKVVTEFINGNATIIINPVDTKNLMPRTYIYDIQVKFAGTENLTIVPPKADMPPCKFILTEEVTYE